MANQVPFPFVSDLPPRAQRELERDFFELQRQITASASVYDCIIDATQASNPATHIYKNLTDAIAGETQYTAGVDLSVGVVQRATVRIAEPGSVNIAGRGAITIAAISGGYTPDATTLGWDFRGLTCTLGQQVNLIGLTIDPQIAGAGLCDQGFLSCHDCYFGANMTSPSGRNAQFWSCSFLGALLMTSGGGVGITFTFFNCQSFGGFTTNTSLVGLLWYGGVIGGNVSISNGASIYATISSNISGTGNLDLHCLGGGGSLVWSGTGDVNAEVSGMSGVTLTNTGRKYIRGTSNFSGGMFDITGPADIHVSHLLNNFGSHTILRGDGILATVSAQPGGRLECIGMTNSQARYSCNNTSGGQISLDAGSHNNIIIASGSHNTALFTYTDSGTLNRLITEDIDSIISSPPAAAISANMLPAEIAAVDSGVKVYGGNTVANVDYAAAFLLMGG